MSDSQFRPAYERACLHLEVLNPKHATLGVVDVSKARLTARVLLMHAIQRKNVVAFVLLVGAVGSYVLWRFTISASTPPLEPLPAEVVQSFKNWSTRLEPDWNTSKMTTLEDFGGLWRAIAALVDGVSPPAEMALPSSKKEAIIECLATFFYSWSSSDAETYLRRMESYRMPIEHAADGVAVLGAYRELTGNTLPLHLPTKEVLQRLWAGRTDVPGRPIAISLSPPNATIDFHLYNPDGDPRNSTRLSNMSAETSNRWFGPLATSLPCLTTPKTTMADVRREYGPWLERVFVGVVVQASTGERFPLQIRCFWSPSDGKWQLVSVGAVTLEYVAWPY